METIEFIQHINDTIQRMMSLGKSRHAVVKELSMEQDEYLFSGNTWFKERLNGPEKYFWRKAWRMFLFDHDLSSALNIFKFDYKAIKTEFESEGIVLRGSRNADLDPNEKREHLPGQSWTDDAQNSIRTLLDRIVTRWIPKYMSQSKINIDKLHCSLTPVPLRSTQATYDNTNDDVESYNVEKALQTYQSCMVPLYYHELWYEIVRDFNDIATNLKERETIINIQLFYEKMTLDDEKETALIFGTNQIIYAEDYKPLSKKLGLFDIVLINIDNVDYLGMIVHVKQNKVQEHREHEKSNNNYMTNTNYRDSQFELEATIGIYVSRKCSDIIQQRRKQTKDDKLAITKLSNITSSRRLISAIHNLEEWPQHRSILKPTIDDIYFQLPENYDPSDVSSTNGFNEVQSQIIAIAECMLDEHDIYDRMHIVHGPPGTGKSRTIAGIVLKLLAKLSKSKDKRKKILLCAPSNNACDELSRRILDEFDNQGIVPKSGTLVRIGCHPPDDYRLSNYFLDFMILQEMVDALKRERRINANLAQQTETRIMRHAKIVISTLNYCGSTRMHQLKSSTAFVIIDEASQSSEADCLLPLRFKCKKVMLVGDPSQLEPCVLSNAGKQYCLSTSLYKRLYCSFQHCSNRPISMLNMQYRMHDDICRFPSASFYFNRLKTDESVAKSMKHYLLKRLYLYNMTNSPHEYDGAKSSHNKGEAAVIRDFCHKLIEHLAQKFIIISGDTKDNKGDENSNVTSPSNPGQKDDSRVHENMRDIHRRIAVITPYKAQFHLLSSYLPRSIEIMTADSSQGKEKDIVILSCVRSGGDIGFLNDMNRLNVMLTRSKNALYIFGNLTHLADQHEKWRDLVDYAREHKIICDINSVSPDLPYCS